MICLRVVTHSLFRRIVMKTVFNRDYLMLVLATLLFVMVRKASILLYVSSV